MCEGIQISQKEYEHMKEFDNRNIDHVFIKNPDGLNYYLICHGCNSGYIQYNGRKCKLSDILDEVYEELQISKNSIVFIDVICCFGLYQIPCIENNIRIKSMFSNDSVIYYEYNATKCYIYDKRIDYIIYNNLIH